MVLCRSVSLRGLAVVSLCVAGVALAVACATPYGNEAELPLAVDSGDAEKDGAGADAEADADVGAPDGAAGPTATTCTKDGGTGCRCPPMATCNITCTNGPCQITCTNATCDVTCNNDCSVLCDSASRCTVRNGNCSANAGSQCTGI
jgi:hypothetical protein